MPPSTNDVTGWLVAWRSGDQTALDKLVPVIYQELRRLAQRHMRRESIRPADAEFVQVRERVDGVRINAIGSGPLQLLLAITAGKQSDTDRSGALRGQQVPDAVADHDRVVNGHPPPLGRGQEQVRIRLRVPHLIARDDRNFR